MSDISEKVQVIYYDEDDGVLAVFPDIPDGPNGEPLCYRREGEHGYASHEYIATLKPAKKFISTMHLLRAIGYDV